MSAAMFTSAKSAIAKLALVFLLWCGCLLGRRIAGRVRCGWSHFLETVQRKATTDLLSKTIVRKIAISSLL